MLVISAKFANWSFLEKIKSGFIEALLKDWFPRCTPKSSANKETKH